MKFRKVSKKTWLEYLEPQDDTLNDEKIGCDRCNKHPIKIKNPIFYRILHEENIIRDDIVKFCSKLCAETYILANSDKTYLDEETDLYKSII